MSVGIDHDTSAFAVASIQRWWEQMGRVAYPHATRLLITADAGGSNDDRRRAWKTELGRFAAEAGLAVTVCHLPPGTSKWNRIEHRLFSASSTNWRGRPLVSHQVIVELIGATTTRTGPRVQAKLDQGAYLLGVKVSDAELAAVPITPHDWHGAWNYTIAHDNTLKQKNPIELRPLSLNPPRRNSDGLGDGWPVGGGFVCGLTASPERPCGLVCAEREDAAGSLANFGHAHADPRWAWRSALSGSVGQVA